MRLPRCGNRRETDERSRRARGHRDEHPLTLDPRTQREQRGDRNDPSGKRQLPRASREPAGDAADGVVRASMSLVDAEPARGELRHDGNRNDSADDEREHESAHAPQRHNGEDENRHEQEALHARCGRQRD